MPKIRGTAKNSRHLDYEKAFISYCTPDADGRLKSYADVADEFGVSETTVEKWGSRKNWVKHREALGKRKVEQWTDKQVELAGKVNSRLFEKWQKFLTLLEFEFDDIDLQQMLTYDSKGNRSNIKKPDARSYRDFAEALKNATDKLRVLSGQPSEISKSDVTQKTEQLNITPEMEAEANRFLGKENQNAVLPSTASNNPIS